MKNRIIIRYTVKNTFTLVNKWKSALRTTKKGSKYSSAIMTIVKGETEVKKLCASSL